MTVERAWPLVLPLVVLVSLFFSLAWLGVFRALPDWARLTLVAGFALAALAALWPLRGFRLPAAAEIDRRIERANRLEHAPVSTQTDRLSAGDAFADALWREHRRRMAARLKNLTGDLPRTRVPDRDPWGLRAAAALLLVVAFAFSTGPFGGRLGDAFRSAAGATAVPARIDAWVTPPAYTNTAPIFLTADANAETSTFTVPQNSELAVRVAGGSGDETLVLDGAPDAEGAAADPAPGGDARQFTRRLSGDATATLGRGEETLKSWRFRVVADTPPIIRFTEDPARAVNGALELAYQIDDDHGATAAEADFALAAPDEAARPLYGPPEMALSVPARRGDGTAESSADLTEHPWSGARVRLTLEARDAAGQTARSETRTIVLPEWPFTNPLARALIEQRRMLALDANAQRRVVDLIDALTLRPEDTFDNAAHFLGLSTVRTRLAMAGSDAALRDVVDYMWEVARNIEDGDLTAAERRLRQAQEALRQALENDASDEEIERLMAELREAMREFLREFAERAMQNPNLAQQMPQDGEMMRQGDLERMLDQIENLARSGARDQAQELLSQLQEMMNNLQAGRQQQQQQGGQQQSEMRQQMDRLGEIMRRQQEMMNETFRLDQMQRGQRQPGQPGQQGRQPGQRGEDGQQPGQGQGMSPEELAEALRGLQQGQGDLQGELEALMRGLENLGIQPGEGFGEAGEAMGQAESALGGGEGERAVGEQGRALEALRRGAQDMMNQMQQAMRGQQGGGEEGGRQQNADRDPLGRPRATTGPDFGDTVEVPDEIDIQRAREILEAIRRRLGDALSPEVEREYLERLLNIR
ncbi:TIGR02302 family protein [Aquibium sp. A9E412]|nr:TIGR02302 family protein [Aquibium sp. A9E412]MDN2568374.1 TIGR02302 family protein [Aquibium sp. A9E412]